MATTSEIQVTEAYIGLLGRAPDPDGLAYWTAELDAAIAAGEDPAVALKKLTNDITLSDEWDAGLGSNDAKTLAGATEVVKGMYLNLFERSAKTADIDYWAPKIVSGEFTASEMAVALIQGSKASNDGAGNADSQTLALKQEAATYYVEKVAQEDFNRETAKVAVDSVDSPNSLQASKDATDIIVSGEGISFTFKAATTDTVPVTGGDDTATGTVGTGVTYANVDSFLDLSTSDNDTMTLTGDADFNFGPTSNVENINVTLSKRDLAGGFTIDADKETGGSKINLTVPETVNVGGVDLAAERKVTINNLASDLTTTNVKDLTVTLDPAASHTFTLDSSLATLDIGAVDYNDTTVTLANNDVTFALTGAGANDVISITADNEVTINVGGNDVESMTLAGSNNDVVFTIAGVNDANDITYTAAGANDITLAGSAESFSGATLVDSNSGTEALKLTATGGAASIEGFGALSGGISLGADAAFNLLLASGNTVTNSVAQSAAVTFNANDTATDSSITIALDQNTNGINTDKFESVTITTNDSKANSLGALDFDGVGVVTVSGTNDVTTGAISNANTIEVSGEDINVGAVTATNEVTLTASKSVTTAAMTVVGDITATAGAGQDVNFGAAVAITKGNLEATGDDVNAANTIAVTAGNITLTSTANDVDLENTVTATKGTVTITAVEDVEAANTITSTAGSVKIAAGNDVTVAAITAANDVDIDAGAGVAGLDVLDMGTITVTKGNVTVDGDDVNQTAGSGIDVAAGNITITASNNVDLDSAIDTDSGATTITATAGSVDLAAVAVQGSSVTVTAGTDIIDASTITAANDVSLTTATGVGNDITHTGTINVATSGNVIIDADDTTVGAIDVAKGNITITADNMADTNGAIDTDSGSVTITGSVAKGSEGVETNGTIDATNDIIITATAGEVDINETVTTTLGDITITANEIDINDTAGTTTALSAVGGDINLTATSTDKANDESLIAHAVTAKNVNLIDGNFHINATVTATDSFTVQGDTDLDVDDIAAEAIVITTSNDVTVQNTTDSSFIVTSGSGDYDLGKVEYDAATTAISVTTGAGNDTLDLDDDTNISVYTVVTGGGNDSVTITEVAATSLVNTGSGVDSVDFVETVNSVTVVLGDGNDSITVRDGNVGSIDGGNDSDTINLINGVDYSDDAVTWKNIEKLSISGAGSATLSEAQLDNDGTFEVQHGSGTITVAGVSLDASGVTYKAGSTVGFALNGTAAANTLKGTSNADTITGGAAADTMTGGAGVDIFVLGTADATIDANGVGADVILDMNASGSADIIRIAAANNVTADEADGTTAGSDGDVANGKLTFNAADDTLAEKIAIAIIETGANEVVFFEHGSDSYLYISGASGDGTDDQMIKLTGLTGMTTLAEDGTTAGDFGLTP
jgi:hypothetical protein